MLQQHRLSINLNDESAEFLQEFADYNDISIAEVVRQAIFVMNFVESELKNGRVFQTMKLNNRDKRDIIFP